MRRRGLSPEEVAADQRRRVYAALAPAIAEYGYERLSVKQAIEAARISRRTFYELFEDKAEAFLGAFDEALDRLDRAVGDACSREPHWPLRVRAAVGNTLEFAAAESAAARLLTCEPFTAGPHLRHCQEERLARFGPALREGRELAPVELPPFLEEMTLGGLAGVIAARLNAGEAATLPALTAELTHVVLAPYVGTAEAERASRS